MIEFRNVTSQSSYCLYDSPQFPDEFVRHIGTDNNGFTSTSLGGGINMKTDDK